MSKYLQPVLRPNPKCPSCKGTGWAVVRAGNITFAQGACKCVGGKVWAKHPFSPSDAAD